MLHDGDRLSRQHRRRFLLLLAVVLAATLVAATEPLHRATRSVLELAQPVIAQHAIAGAVVFVIASGLSAMVVFFSTAVLTPIAVEAWGRTTTVLLLWLGWILGGMTAYAIGRVFGRRVVSWFVDPRRLHDYEGRARSAVSFRHVLLFQLAVPSEIPGYVFGLARYRFATFAAAMALGELPFAIGAVFLGASFLGRNYVLLFAIGTGGVLLSWLAFRRAAKMWRSATPPPDPADRPASATGGVPPYASDSPR